MPGDDTNQIVNVLNLYALAVDTLRWELFDRVFVPNVDADYGAGAHWRDVASLKRDFGLLHAPLDGSQHTVTNHQVIVAGDRAHALSYVVVRLMRQMTSGENFWEAGGWYDDALVRTLAGWRIEKRFWRGNWSRGNTHVAEPTPDSRFDVAIMPLRAAGGQEMISYLKMLTGR